MESSSFVRKTVLAVYILIAAVLLALASDLGLFGASVKTVVGNVISAAHQLYLGNQQAFDLAALVIGGSVSAVTGTMAILRAFYYAERNLPARLQELIDSSRANHTAVRPSLLAYASASSQDTDFLAPTLGSPLQKLLNVFGGSQAHYKARDLATSIDLLDGQLTTIAARQAELREQKVTAHLLRAAHLHARALVLEADSAGRTRGLESAVQEYLAALKISAKDLDALAGLALEYRYLGRENDELSTLRRLIDAAARRNDALVQARAHRASAAILARAALRPKWDEARGHLNRAVELLNGVLRSGMDETLEMATTYLLLGQVQAKREKFSASRQALSRAHRLFSGLEGPISEQGIKDTKEALDELSADSEDNEEPESTSLLVTEGQLDSCAEHVSCS